MRKISFADYLVEFLIKNGVTDVFGYQGGMVCHIFDSLGNYKDKINYHSCCNEQGAAFAACGYAQATGKLGVCITTSGPGFTNALTGLSNAWYDSIPFMLISGQVNTKDKKRNLQLRQYGFQEIQAQEIAKSITKKVYELDSDSDLVESLKSAYIEAFSDRMGPVYIDLPINLQREIVEIDSIRKISIERSVKCDVSTIIDDVFKAKKPIIIAGAGVKQNGLRESFRELVELLDIPVVTSLPGTDLLPTDSPHRVGFMGGTGRREASVVLKNTDFVITMGTRLCNKSIGYNHNDFIPKAKRFIRIDIDNNEFDRKIKDFEEDILVDINSFIKDSIDYIKNNNLKNHNHKERNDRIIEVKKVLKNVDLTFGNEIIEKFTSLLPESCFISADVGNNLIYVEQSAVIKSDTKIYESAGLGSMGYSLPASIGMAIGSNKKVYAIMGDGGIQMNIQELNTISKMNLPIKILIMNNHVLGHIILFQDHYLDCRRIATTEERNDYYSCDFSKIANSYGIRSYKINNINQLVDCKKELLDDKPLLIEFDFEDCSMLPNIHGGLDPLENGPKLSESTKHTIKNLMSF